MTHFEVQDALISTHALTWRATWNSGDRNSGY